MISGPLECETEGSNLELHDHEKDGNFIKDLRYYMDLEQQVLEEEGFPDGKTIINDFVLVCRNWIGKDNFKLIKN